MKTVFTLLSALIVLLSLSTSLKAQNKENDVNNISGFRKEFLDQLQEVQDKIIGLAEAIPAEKYSWRPMEGVRSVGEVFTHIAGGNYLFPSMVGHKTPKDYRADLDKISSDKEQIINALKKSFEFIDGSMSSVPNADLDKPATMFGKQTTVRDVFFTAATHMHEHMGQMIAYTRMNKIVPPWTAAEQAKEQKEKK